MSIRSADVDREFKRTIYIKMRLLGKLVEGADIQLWQEEAHSLGVSFHFDFSNTYLLATGIDRSILSRIESGQYEYFQLAAGLGIHLHEVWESEGYYGESFYNERMNLCILFSPGRNGIPCSPEALAEKMHTSTVAFLQNEVLILSDSACVFSTMYGPAKSFEEISSHYLTVCKYKSYSFFYMQPIVFTEKTLAALQQALPFIEYTQILREMDNCINDAQQTQFCELLDKLLLKKLKYTFDFQLTEEIVAMLKQRFLKMNEIYNLHYDEAFAKWDLSHFITIEELHDYIADTSKLCMDEIMKQRVGLSEITQNAILYMKRNYQKQLSLNDIATYAHVVPQYLSSLFNREMGISIPVFLAQARIEEAKALLQNSTLSIKEIAASVGIQNDDYFSQIFKRYCGMTPGKYREQQRTFVDGTQR